MRGAHWEMEFEYKYTKQQNHEATKSLNLFTKDNHTLDFLLDHIARIYLHNS